MPYLSASMRALAAAVALSATAAQAGETELGAALPDYSRKVAERRWRSSRDWEGTMKFFRENYPQSQFPRRSIVNQPGVKAVHIANPSGKAKWEGLNVYEHNDEVRIYVVPAEQTGMKKKPRK